VQLSPLLEMLLRLLLAAALGAAIGYERERHGKAAGLRDHILISVGAALFTLASIFGFGAGADSSRVAAGVVAGVGFIGAGVIFRAAGAGLYLISAAATAITVGILLIPKTRD